MRCGRDLDRRPSSDSNAQARCPVVVVLACKQHAGSHQGQDLSLPLTSPCNLPAPPSLPLPPLARPGLACRLVPSRRQASPDTLTKGSRLGPLVSEEQFHKVMAYIEVGRWVGDWGVACGPTTMQ